MVTKEESLKRQVNDIEILSDIYKQLFELIAKLSPTIYEDLAQIVDGLDDMTLDLDSLCSEYIRKLETCMRFVKRNLTATTSLRSRDEIDNELCLLLLFSLYKLAYRHGDSWYVLMDGIVFEGFLEVKAMELLESVEEKVEDVSVLRLLEIIEDLSQASVFADENRTKSAQQEFDCIVKKLDGRGFEVDAEKLRRFCGMYDRMKYWQIRFHQASGEFLEPNLPLLREEISNTVKALGYDIDETMIAPWNFIPYLEDVIIPIAISNSWDSSEQRTE